MDSEQQLETVSIRRERAKLLALVAILGLQSVALAAELLPDLLAKLVVVPSLLAGLFLTGKSLRHRIRFWLE